MTEEMEEGGLAGMINAFLRGESVSREHLEQMAADAVSSVVGRRVTVEEIRSGQSRIGQIDIDVDGLKVRFGEFYSRVSSRVRPGAKPSSSSAEAQRAREAREQRRQQEAEANRRAREKASYVSRARRILGYTAKEPVTKEMIKDRQRELARKHHPDRGGDVRKMQEINWAVDILLSPA